jgi:2Fe-2S ferredoxin
MTRVNFTVKGSEQSFDAGDDPSVMRVAVREGIPGIFGDCGGEMSCGTCHVYVEDQSHVPEMSEDEDVLLEVVDDRRDTSRLGCQLRFTEGMPDLHVEVPDV